MRKKMMGKTLRLVHALVKVIQLEEPLAQPMDVAKHLQVHTEPGTHCLTDKQCSTLAFPEDGTIPAAVSSKTEMTY